MNLPSFTFSNFGIEIVLNDISDIENGSVWLEHQSGGQKKKIEVADHQLKKWVIPFEILQEVGVYQFRYRDGNNGQEKVLGGGVARGVKKNTDRLLAEQYFQKLAILYRATLYVPYSRKSIRLRVDVASSRQPSLTSFQFLKLSSIRNKFGKFTIRGAGIVTGVRSDSLTPYLDFRNHLGETLYSLVGERVSRPSIQKKYGIEDDDHLWSGFKFEFSASKLAKISQLSSPIRLNLFVRLCQSDGTEYSRPIYVMPAEVGKKNRLLMFYEPWFKRERFSIISAAANNQLVFQRALLPTISSPKNALKRALALGLYKMLGRPSSKTWVFFEYESSMAQDNGLALFAYIRENRTDIKSIFIIDKSSRDLKNLEKYESYIVYKYTFRHFWILLTARVLVSSQSRYHSYRIAPSPIDPYANALALKPFIFLQHGVLGLKKIKFHRSNYRVSADLFFSSTAYEKELICEDFGYEPSQVPLVGLPRFDQLYDSSLNFREILVMPTWRKWLQNINDESFKKSDFFVNYVKLLSDQRLIKYCKTHKFKINLYLHPIIGKHVRLFKDLPDVVNIVTSGERNINELLMSARVLVTDYSSVAWDFAYMKKPIAFFHFDIEEYNSYHGAFFDIKRELGNLSFEKPRPAVEKIIEWIDGGEIAIPHINKFEHYDRNNSQRGLNAIEEFLGRGQ